MKICIHSNQFDGRGTGKTPYDYGVAIRNILGHDVCYMVSSQSKNEGLHRIKKEFPVYMSNLCQEILIPTYEFAK